MCIYCRAIMSNYRVLTNQDFQVWWLLNLLSRIYGSFVDPSETFTENEGHELVQEYGYNSLFDMTSSFVLFSFVMWPSIAGSTVRSFCYLFLLSRDHFIGPLQFQEEMGWPGLSIRNIWNLSELQSATVSWALWQLSLTQNFSWVSLYMIHIRRDFAPASL